MPLWTPPRAHPDLPEGAGPVLKPSHRAWHRFDDPAVWGALAGQRHNPFRDFNFQSRHDELYHGWDEAESAAPGIVKDFHDRYAHHLARAHPAMNVPTSAIADIAASGRIKSQFETNTSSGVHNPGRRADVEHKQLGYAHDLPAHARPVYGYLTRHPFTDDSTSTYGPHTFVLHKPSLWHRTTFTGGDSMVMGEPEGDDEYGSPSPVTDHLRTSIPIHHFGISPEEADGLPAHHVARRLESDPEDLADMFWRRGDRENEFPYPEAQYHGGVNLHHVRYAILRSPVGKSPGDSRMHPEVARAAEHLTSAGIPWVHTHGYSHSTQSDAWHRPGRAQRQLPPHIARHVLEGALVAAHEPHVAWRRPGGEAYIVGLSAPGRGGLAMGQVADLDWGILHPPMPVASILARGYWEACEHPVDAEDVLARVRPR